MGLRVERRVMTRAVHLGYPGTQRFVQDVPDRDLSGMSITNDLWKSLGQPEVITVTVEEGDSVGS